MAYIGPLPAETFTSFATQEFSTSATTSYTLNHPVTNENELALFINNVRQQPGSGKAYTATGTALTLSEATASTDTMYAVFLGRALQTVNPADASVGTSQLASTSVTAAKLNNDIISGHTALAATPADTDELLISDAGTLKRIDYSLLKSTPGLVHIQTTTISTGTASVEFTSGIGSTYDAYKFFISGVHPATDSVHFKVLLSTDGGSSYISSYRFAIEGIDSGNNQGTAANLTSGSIEANLNRLGNANDESYSSEMTLFKPSGTTFHQHIIFQSSYYKTNGQMEVLYGSGSPATSLAAIDAVKFELESGNIDAGTFQLFGVSKS